MASQRILGHSVDLSRSPEECAKVVAELEKEQRGNFEGRSEFAPKPMMSILESGDDNFLERWHMVFSETLSPVMHLFGSKEPAEIESYNIAFQTYFDRIVHETQERVNSLTAESNNIQDITMPVIKNLPTKLKWLQLGFFPTNEVRVNLPTPFPLFDPKCMQVLMALWNTAGVVNTDPTTTKKKVEIDNGPALAEVN